MIDAITRHQIYLNRYAGGVFREVVPLLKQMRDDISARILTATEYEKANLSLILTDLNTIINGSFAPLSETIFDNMDELVEYEQKYTIGLINNFTTASVIIGAGTQPELLKALYRNKAMILQGEAPITVNQMIEKLNRRYKQDIKNIIELGILEGKTVQEMAREVNRVTNGRTSNQTEAIIRTITNHAGSVARQDTFASDEELFKGEQFVATLDSRTTIICASKDGNIYPFNSGPFPPLHYQCRSVRVPVVKDEYLIVKDSTRASVDGPVSNKLTYSGWLRRQPREVQDEILGVERAKLFRSGKYTLDKFIDPTGRTYTLEELEQADLIV